MQVEPPKAKPQKKAKRKTPPGPGLKVSDFVDLMRRLERLKDSLTDDQFRFVQNCIQRFEVEANGTVKTRLALPKPKKQRHKPAIPGVAAQAALSVGAEPAIDRLVHAQTDDEVLEALNALDHSQVERMAKALGFRVNSPSNAREKLIEMVMHLRQIERIASAKTTALQNPSELADGVAAGEASAAAVGHPQATPDADPPGTHPSREQRGH